MRYIAGFDIGGTKISLVLTDRSGKRISETRKPTVLGSSQFYEYADGVAYSGLSDQMIAMLEDSLQQAQITSLAAIGIGSAGPLDEGGLKDPPNIILPDVPSSLPQRPIYIPLTTPLSKRFDVPVLLDNDCSAAVLGELHYGVGRKEEDKTQLYIVYVTLSTGFGGGIWDGGKLVRGKHGNTEVGHTVVRDGGLKCGCGNYGCAEAYCSGAGITRNAQSRLAAQRLRSKSKLFLMAASTVDDSVGLSPSEILDLITPQMVFTAAEQGDTVAKEVIQDATHYGGIAFANIANSFDPQIITVGGSIALNHPNLVTNIEQEMRKHVKVSPPQVLLSPLDHHAVEYGALVLAQQALTNNKQA